MVLTTKPCLEMDARCPLGDALDESCSTDSCSSGFLPLTEEVKTVVFLITRHSVSSLCDAPRKRYIKMQSLSQKKCCDLLKDTRIS